MASGEVVVCLRHGTTRKRAEAIIRDGPNPYFREPGGLDLTEGFSTARLQDSYPETIADGKARLFPNEGGPAFVEIEVPESIVQKADLVVEVRFEPGFGLEELLAVWPLLAKRIVIP